MCMYIHVANRQHSHTLFSFIGYNSFSLHPCVRFINVAHYTYVQAVSANSSQTDLYAVVDKKNKSSMPFVPDPFTRPFCRHDYEDIDDELPPKPLPYQHLDSRPNGSGPPKVPAPYQSSVSNKETSPRKIGELHSNSVDILLSNTGYVVCFN